MRERGSEPGAVQLKSEGCPRPSETAPPRCCCPSAPSCPRGAASAVLCGFSRFGPLLCSSASLAIGVETVLSPAHTGTEHPPTVTALPEGAAHLGSAGFGDRKSRKAQGRKTGFSGAHLASPDRPPREPTPLELGLPSKERARVAAGAPLLSRARRVAGGGEALSWLLGGQLWPPACARAGERPGWPEAQRGRAGGHRPPVGGLAWPSLWTQCPGLLHGLAGRQGTVAGRGHGQPADWGRGASWPEQRACLYNLTCHLGQGEEQLVWEGDKGGWRPARASAILP